MDVHIHLRGAFDPSAAPDAEPGPPNRQAGVEALASFLYAGVTTVLDVGNRPEHILPLRADERAGRILSPRIFATGNLITYPGSHGDRVALRISDFEKDKELLDKHIAEQQLDVIRIATYNSAVFLGKADQLGSIDTGKLADLVLLSKDPAADINNAKSIVFVMKGGRIVDENELPLAGGKEKRRFEL